MQTVFFKFIGKESLLISINFPLINLCVKYIYAAIHRLFIAEYALCIQHNFTTLQDELPEADYATTMMEHVLSESNVSDIQHCRGTIRQKSKLLKILISNGQHSCKELFNAIESNLKRTDLIQKMMNKSTDVTRRGNIYL